MTTGNKSALLLGATGLVGSHCLEMLLADTAYSSVRVLARRATQIVAHKLDWQVVDFDNLSEHRQLFDVDVIFSCLGSTIKKAGSAEAFRHIDYDYVLDAGKIAAEMDVDTFVLVSSVGANPRSPFLYMRTKGDLELAIGALGIPKLTILRPNILLGKRNEFRLSEWIGVTVMKLLGFLLVGPFKRFRGNHSASVAKAMLSQAHIAHPGTNIISALEIMEMAKA